MSTTGIIIGREYGERVKKKSFIITTLLMPILMLALMAVPAMIALWGSQTGKNIYVVDHSGVVGSRLVSDEDYTFTLTSLTPDSASNTENVDGVLIIPAGIIERDAPVEYLTDEATSISLESALTSRVADIVEQERMAAYPDLDVEKIISSVHADISMKTFRTDKDNEQGSSGLSYILGLVLTMMLYMCLLLYGQMVMTGIIEEKNNRVLEIVVSSVKPSRLMLGKIAGIGLVAVTQIAIWAVLITVISAFVIPAILPQSIANEVSMFNSGNLDPTQATIDTDLLQALGMLGDTGYLINLRSDRFGRRQYPGRLTATDIRRYADHTRHHVQHVGHSRSDVFAVSMDVNDTLHKPHGHDGPNTLRHRPVADSRIARHTSHQHSRHDMARRKDLPRGHIHVWQETHLERTDQVDSLQISRHS